MAVDRFSAGIGRVAGLIQPILDVVAEIAPHRLRDLVEVAFAFSVPVLGPDAVVEPVGLVFVLVLVGGVGHESAVSPEIHVGDVPKLREVVAVGRRSHLVEGGGAHVICIDPREDVGLGGFDLGQRIRRSISPVVLAGFSEFRIWRGVVEGRIQEDGNVRGVGGIYELAEFLQRASSAGRCIVARGVSGWMERTRHDRHHGEEVPHGVRTAEFEGPFGVGINLASFFPARMNRLKPYRVQSELPDVVQTEGGRAGRGRLLSEVSERAAVLRHRTAGGDRERIKLV